jgi:hypothetical protein
LLQQQSQSIHCVLLLYYHTVLPHCTAPQLRYQASEYLLSNLSKLLQLSLLPILYGMWLNHNTTDNNNSEHAFDVKRYTAITTSVLSALLTGSTVARNKLAFAYNGTQVLLATILMHTGGLALG